MAQELREEKYGRLISCSQCNIHQEVERIERCVWVDTSLRLLKVEKNLAQKVENWYSVIDPTSMAAFNFDHNIKKRAQERANNAGTAVTSVRLEGSLDESTFFKTPDDEKIKGGCTRDEDEKGNNEEIQEWKYNWEDNNEEEEKEEEGGGVAKNPGMEVENKSTTINSLHSGSTNKDDAMDLARGKENNADGGKFEKEKQSTANQHMHELTAAHQTIAMMQAQLERLKRLIMTQHIA